MADMRLRGVYGKPFGKRVKLEPTKDLLERLGACLLQILQRESKKDFAKRGWSGRDPKGGPPIWDSFDYGVQGQSTLVLTSTFYGMDVLVSGDIPSRKMDWLTQEYKDKHPNEFPLTDREKKLGMKRTGRVLKSTKGKARSALTGRYAKRSEGRLPLVVPMKSGGTVIFRTAPLKMQDAWVHPGIAKFTFMQRAIKKGKVECAKILGEEMVKQALKGGV